MVYIYIYMYIYIYIYITYIYITYVYIYKHHWLLAWYSIVASLATCMGGTGSCDEVSDREGMTGVERIGKVTNIILHPYYTFP